MSNKLSFQDMILALQAFWSKQGCAILQPYDVECGAGTFHPATVLQVLEKEKWNVAYVQPSRRPTDSRFGDHPNRMQHYYQFQVIMKPSPENSQRLYLDSLKAIGLDCELHDIRFVEDDWESPSIGAAGLGWEVWCDGMEVSQFTYMQQIGGIPCVPAAVEITYGLERLAMYIQGKNDYKDLVWSAVNGETLYTYADIDLMSEKQFSEYNLFHADVDVLRRHFIDAEEQCGALMQKSLPYAAYDFCIKASHIFNLLNSRGVLSVTERAVYVGRIRALAKSCCAAVVRQN